MNNQQYVQDLVKSYLKYTSSSQAYIKRDIDINSDMIDNYISKIIKNKKIEK